MRKLKTALAVLAGAVMAGTAFAADSITVPTDPKARYWATEVKRKGDLVVITTFRKGPSDISTAKRLVDCKAKRFKYLETDGVPDPGAEFGPLVTGSISAYVAAFACSKAQ
jgi:hypothetical protein